VPLTVEVGVAVYDAGDRVELTLLVRDGDVLKAAGIAVELYDAKRSFGSRHLDEVVGRFLEQPFARFGAELDYQVLCSGGAGPGEKLGEGEPFSLVEWRTVVGAEEAGAACNLCAVGYIGEALGQLVSYGQLLAGKPDGVRDGYLIDRCPQFRIGWPHH